MVDEFGLTVIDGTLTVQAQQRLMREIVRKELEGWEGLPIPDVPPKNLLQSDIYNGKGGANV
jgi:hypothetical protein